MIDGKDKAKKIQHMYNNGLFKKVHESKAKEQRLKYII